MNDATKAALELKAIIVQSDIEDVLYAIHKDKKAMSLFVGSQEILIHAENIIPFLLEGLDVWKVWGTT